MIENEAKAFECPSNWRSARVAQGTIFDAINRNFSNKPSVVPKINGDSPLLIGSDYSGESAEEPYRVYSVIVTTGSSWLSWENKRLDLRKQIFPDSRRMSYKKLGDQYRTRFLAPILEASDELEGLLVSVAISKSVPSIFSDKGPLNLQNDEFEVFRSWRQPVLEKAFIILHLTGLLIAGLGKEGQNVFWFTDQDQIAANPKMLTALTKALSWVSSEYLNFDLGHLRCGTTSCDNGSLQIEDFVCIPDLVAGTLSEQFRSSISNAVKDDNVLWLTGSGLKTKAQSILFWMATRQQKLKKHVFVVDPGSSTYDHKFSWFNYGNGNSK